MNKPRMEIHYNKKDKTIMFGEKTIVDMKGLPENARGKVFSKVAARPFAKDFRLVVGDSHFPFNIQLASFSPSGFIKAIVENRLEVDVMVTSDDITHAYNYLSESSFF